MTSDKNKKVEGSDTQRRIPYLTLLNDSYHNPVEMVSPNTSKTFTESPISEMNGIKLNTLEPNSLFKKQMTFSPIN